MLYYVYKIYVCVQDTSLLRASSETALFYFTDNIPADWEERYDTTAITLCNHYFRDRFSE